MIGTFFSQLGFVAVMDSPSGSSRRLDDFKRSFARLDGIPDPLAREMERLAEAERLGIPEKDYSALLEIYHQSHLPDWMLERKLRQFVEWSGRLSALKVLEYLGRLSVLIALVSFLFAYSDRTRQEQDARLRVLESTQGREVSGARIEALQRLNEACVDFAGLEAKGALLYGLHLDRCYARLLGFPVGELRGAGLFRASLPATDLRLALLPRANLAFSNLSGAFLERADLRGAVLRGANLVGAHLFHANLQDADLQDARLEDADLDGTDLRRSNLTWAHLPGASLIGARLAGATLQYADLREIKAARVDLRGADLFRAQLQQARLFRARFDGRTNLDSADLGRTDLREASGLSAEMFMGAKDLRSALTPIHGPPLPSKPLRVGLIALDSQYFFEEVLEGARQAAVEDGAAQVIAPPALPSGSRQFPEEGKFDQLITMGLDGILVDIQHKYESGPNVRKAVEAGLLLTCYDHCAELESTRRYMTGDFESDQFEVGRKTGKLVAQWIGKQPKEKGKALAETEVGILRVCESDGCMSRVKGFRTALDEAEVAWRQSASYTGSGADGPRLATELLNEHSSVQVAWSANEKGTVDLVEAVRSLRRQGKVRVWGTDMSPTIADMLLDPDDVLQGVTAQQPYVMGYCGMRSLLSALRDKESEAETQYTDLEVFERGDRRAIEDYRKSRNSRRAVSCGKRQIDGIVAWR